MKRKKPKCPNCGSKKAVIWETEDVEELRNGFNGRSRGAIIDIIWWAIDEIYGVDSEEGIFWRPIDERDEEEAVERSSSILNFWKEEAVRMVFCPSCKRVEVSPLKQKKL